MILFPDRISHACSHNPVPIFSNVNSSTHVAGTVCGAQYGVSSNCTLCSVKVFNATGHGTVDGAITGIDHVVSKCSSGGIRCVVNMSLESKKSDFFNRVVANAVSKGVVMVVAAGNNNTDACSSSPASSTSAITVGSTTRTDIKSSFSNWGSCVDVYAPGSSITSAWISSSTAIGNKSGTSMASPRKCMLIAWFRLHIIKTKQYLSHFFVRCRWDSRRNSVLKSNMEHNSGSRCNCEFSCCSSFRPYARNCG